MRAVVFVSKCELVLFPWFPSIPIPALANDVLGSLPRKLQSQPSKVPLSLMCALLFKGVAVPLRACVMLLKSCCAPAAAPNPIRCLPEMVRPPEGASKIICFKVALFKMI